MVTEGEITESELRQIRLQNTVMMDIQFSQHVLTPEFKNRFKRIQKKTCKECGKHFRITHWCEDQHKQIWIPNWETVIRANFKPKNREISVYKLEEYDPILDLQEEYQRNPITMPAKSVNLAKPQRNPKKMKIPNIQPARKPQPHPTKKKMPKQPPKSKPQPIPVKYIPPAKKKQSVKTQYTPKPQKKQLSVQSITQLTQKERLVYDQIKNWRNLQANRERKQPYLIAVDTALMAIVFYRVSNTHELMQISGFTTHSAQQYGTDILRIMIRNGMATGIKTYQQQRKPTGIQKIVSPDETNTKKIILGFVCCFVVIIILVVLMQI